MSGPLLQQHCRHDRTLDSDNATLWRAPYFVSFRWSLPSAVLALDESLIIFIHSLCPGGRREGGRPDTEKTRGQDESRQNSAAKETGDCGMSGPRVVLAQIVKC